MALLWFVSPLTQTSVRIFSSAMFTRVTISLIATRPDWSQSPAQGPLGRVAIRVAVDVGLGGMVAVDVGLGGAVAVDVGVGVPTGGRFSSAKVISIILGAVPVVIGSAGCRARSR